MNHEDTEMNGMNRQDAKSAKEKRYFAIEQFGPHRRGNS